MKVGDLHKYFADLGTLLGASGAKGVAGDLEKVCGGLAPFKDYSVKDFADFLVRAEKYSRGEVPVTGGSKGDRQTGGARTQVPDADLMAKEIFDLYEQAASPTVTNELIEAKVANLAALTKEGLMVVAEAIDLKGMSGKTKPAIITAIKLRIINRKGATQRNEMIDRVPGTTAASNPVLTPAVTSGG